MNYLYRHMKYAYLPTKTEDAGWVWRRPYQIRRVITGKDILSGGLSIVKYQERYFASDFKEYDDVDLMNMELSAK